MISLWHDGVELPHFPKLDGNTKTQILIIGGGIAGLLTAYLLHERGIPYLLVEKNTICSGTTQDTTAKITYQHGLIYADLIKRYGVDTARMYLEANRSAFDKYSELCADIDCDHELKDNYVYSTSDRQRLEDEMSALDRLGFSASFCETPDIPVKTVGAVCFPKQAQFHPLKFLSTIAKGLNVRENTFVRDVKENIAFTDKGKIYADKIVVATHFPFINRYGGFFIKLYQHRSYVCALKDAPRVNGMYVDESGKGFSFREHGDLLLLGGGAHRTGKKGGSFEELRRFVTLTYPEARECCHWAAQDCMSLDGMPYIGHYSPSAPNMYVASGFNKWGMTGAMLSAMLLCDALTDTDNRFFDVFSPQRNMLHPQLFVNLGESTLNLLTPTAPRCTHLGCALKWNSAEHTWDCPCHGSRFSEDGKILDNPANTPKKGLKNKKK